MSTISDVANLAGVSTATVSRVLNGYTHVSPRVLERVEKAIAELGYEPNAMAKSLRTLKSNRIVVTVPDIANPFYANIIRGVEETASAAGYAVLLGDIGSAAGSDEAYAALLKRKEADGLIFLGHSLPDSLQERVKREGAAAPVVNGCEFSGSLPVSSVNIDNTAAAREMIEHLHGLGHRRIGVITGDMASPTSRGRLSGVEAAARDLGIRDIQIVNGDYTIESGIARAAELIQGDNRPTAIFCFSDDMAFGAIHALRGAGLNCPDDVSVAGFDDLRLAKYAQPALTTIRQPMHEIGVKTVELLLDIIENGGVERVNVTLGHELVVRASTAAPRL